MLTGWFLAVPAWALAFGLGVPPAAAQPAARVLVLHDETTLAKDAVTFQRGAFRIDPSGREVVVLCVPTQGQWKQAGSNRDCGSSPPPERRRENARFDSDHTFLGIRNLGVTTEEWARVQQARVPGGPQDVYKKIAESFSYAIGATDTRWQFSSGRLPQELKADIPGAGINVHFGGLFSQQRKIPLFDPRGAGIEVAWRMAMPVFVHTGKAHSGMSIALDLEFPTVGGSLSVVPLIVNIMHPRPRDREGMRTDGRVNYVSTYLEPSARFVHVIENHRRSSAWTGLERFAFRVTRENIALMMGEMRKGAGGGDSLDERELDKASVLGVTLRNESRFLEQGDVAIEVVVDYVRVSRDAGGR